MDEKEKKIKKRKTTKKKEEVSSNVKEFIETQRINEEENTKETFENIKQVKERKRHPVLLSLVMLLLGAILGMIGLVALSVNNILTVKNLPNFFEKETTKCEKVEEKKDEEEIKTVTLNTESYIVNHLIESITFNEVSTFLTEPYQDKKVTPSNLSSELQTSLIIKKAKSEYGEEFTLDQLVDAKGFLFGQNVDIKFDSKDSYTYGCGKYTLNKNSHLYEYTKEQTCNRNTGTTLITKVESATKSDTAIIIEIRIGLKTEKGLYAGPNTDYERLDNDFNVGNESSKLKLYRLTFNYDEVEGTYVFTSSEPV